MSVQTLVLILKKNLDTLASECRKYPIILDAVKNTRVALGRISNMFGLKENESLILKPLLLCLEHSGGNVKILSPCLNCIQEMIKHECVKIIGVNILLDMFLRLSPPPTIIKVKILQILLTALTTEFYESQLNQMILGKILTICTNYFVRSDPNSVLNGTSIVVMKQSINTIFPPASSSKRDVVDKKLKPIRLALLQDLCNFVERSPGKWIKVKLQPTTPITFFLEVLEDILLSHSVHLQKDEEYILILKGNIFSSLLNGFNDDRDSYFPEIYRIYRICVVILRMVLFSKKMRSQCVEILKHLTSQILNQKSKMWKRVLSLEVYRRFAEDHTMFIQSILRDRNYFESKEVLVQILDAITAYILRAKERSIKLTRFQYSTNKGKRLETEGGRALPFATDEFECMTLALDTLIGSISSLNILVMSDRDDALQMMKIEQIQEQEESEGEKDEKVEKEEEDEEIKKDEGIHCVRKIVEIEWTNILKACNFLLESCREPDTIQRILQVYFLFTNTCGAIKGLSSVVRDSFLSSLLKYVTRVQTAEHLKKSKKSQMIIQILFDVANSQGSKYLGSSWFILLKNFHEIYGIVLKSIHNVPITPTGPPSPMKRRAARAVASLASPMSSAKRGRAASSDGNSSALPKIFRLILHRLDTLFKNNVSYSYPLESFTQLLRAVIGLSRESLSKVTKEERKRLAKPSPENKNQSSSSSSTRFEPYLSDYTLYFAKKFFLLLEWNASRIGNVFKTCKDVMEHIRYLSTHGSMEVKKFVISKLFELLIVIFSKSTEEEQKKNNEGFSTGEIEKMLFGVLSDSNDYSNELEESIILCIPSLIENASQNLATSWPLILRFLRVRNAKLIHSAFGTVQLIANQFLGELGRAGEDNLYIRDFIKTLSFFGEQNYVEDLNVSLGSISLFLPVFDYLSSSSISLRKKKDDNKEEEQEEQELKKNKSDEMIIFLFRNGLGQLMKDRKEEKRNSTLRYFFDMASPLSNAFCTMTAKRNFLEEILFPLLETLIKRRNQSSFFNEDDDDEEVDDIDSPASPDGGDQPKKKKKKKKKKNRDFVHHSRNTHVKQWDNTLSQAMMNVLVKFLPSNVDLLNAHPKLGDRVFQTVLKYVSQAVIDSPQQHEDNDDDDDEKNNGNNNNNEEEEQKKKKKKKRKKSTVSNSVTFQQLLRNALTCPLPLLKSKKLDIRYQRLVWTTLSDKLWFLIVSRKNWSDEHLILRFLQGIVDILKKNSVQNIFHPLKKNNVINNEEQQQEETEDYTIVINFVRKILSSVVHSDSFQSRKVRACLLDVLVHFVEVINDSQINTLILDFFLDVLILPKPEGIYVFLNNTTTTTTTTNNNIIENNNENIVEISKKKYMDLMLGIREDGMISIIDTFVSKIYLPIFKRRQQQSEEEEENIRRKKMMELYFVKVIKKLGTFMLLRYISSSSAKGNNNNNYGYQPQPEGALWKHCVTSFDFVVRNYMKMNKEEEVSKTTTTTTTTTTWNIVCLIIEDFLFAYFKNQILLEELHQQKEEKEDLEIKLIDLLGDLLRNLYPSLSKENKTYILSLLEKSTTSSKTKKKTISSSSSKLQKSKKKNKNKGEKDDQEEDQEEGKVLTRFLLFKKTFDVLFLMISSDSSLEIVELVYPVILKRSSQILDKYLADLKDVPSYGPLEGFRKDEVVHILRILKDVKVFEREVEEEKKMTIFENVLRNGEKSILMELFPLLSEFVMVDDREIRKCILLLNREVCSYLRLIRKKK